MAVQMTCPICGKQFERCLSRVRAGFCSHECARVHRYAKEPLQLEHRKEGVVALVPLKALDGTIRAYAVVDQADAGWVGLHSWYMNAAGYAERSEKCDGVKSNISLHRAICEMTQGDSLEVDHINRDRLDNRRSNLRVVTKQGNRQNITPSKSKSSKYRGVSLHRPSGLWFAYVKVDGKRRSLGYYRDEEAAGEVALEARRKLMPFSTD